MFSRRLPWDSVENELTRALSERRASGQRVFDLTLSNPTVADLSYPHRQIVDALADGRSLFYHPEPCGLPAARAAVAADFSRRGHEADPQDIVLCASTSDAYAQLFKLLCDPGDCVLAPRPSYPLFEYLAGLEGVELDSYPLAYDGEWHVDFAALTAALTPRTRAILVVNPNNPTGSFLKKAEAARLLEIAGERGIAVISDEVFCDYAYGARPGRVDFLAGVEASALTFSLGGLSKSAGLPQLKLAWIVVGGPAALRDQARTRLETIADAYLSVGTPVQLASGRLLALGETVRAAIRQRVGENLAFLSHALPAGSPVTLLPSEGGWYAVLRFPGTRTDEEIAVSLVRDHGVLTHPGYFFDFSTGTYIVVSLLPMPTVFRPGIQALVGGSPTL